MSAQQAKTIFITGSSSGLGRAAAKLFASRGWRVIATMRSPDKETELASLAGVVLMALDITDPDRSNARRRSGGHGRSRCRLQQRRVRHGRPARGCDRRTDAAHGHYKPDGPDSHHQGVHPSLQREAGRIVHQHDLHRRPDHRPVQLAVPRHEMGARGLEREHGVRVEPVRNRHEDRIAGRYEDRLLHPILRCRRAPRL